MTCSLAVLYHSITIIPHAAPQIRVDAGEQVARLQQRADTEQALMLREAEARHNQASTLAAAAADSAWQFQVEQERERADQEANRRMAAERALEVLLLLLASMFSGSNAMPLPKHV